MIRENDILELKFDGNGISPAILKPSEIGALISAFEKALLLTIKQNNPEIDINTVLFSFEEIKDESLDLRFHTRKVKDIVLSSFFLISTSIANNNFSGLNNGTIQSLKSVVKFTKKYSCTAYFNHNHNTLSTLHGNSIVNINKEYSAKGQTTVYGKLIDAGGENPNIHLKISELETLIIPTSEKIAKELGARLFEIIGLKGIAEWNLLTDEIIDFKIDSILDYREGNASNAFKQLKHISSGYWDNFNTTEEIYAELLRD